MRPYFHYLAGLTLALGLLFSSSPAFAAEFTVRDVFKTPEGTLVNAEGKPVSGILRDAYENGTPRTVTPAIDTIKATCESVAAAMKAIVPPSLWPIIPIFAGSISSTVFR